MTHVDAARGLCPPQPCTVHHGGTAAQCEAAELNLEGGYIASAHRPEPGSRLILDLTSSAGPPVRLVAVVCRALGPGVVVRWLRAVTDGDPAHLDAVLAAALGAATRAGRRASGQSDWTFGDPTPTVSRPPARSALLGAEIGALDASLVLAQRREMPRPVAAAR